MKIAVVAHVRHPIAPPFMGGMEAHSWHLVKALAARGHDVTLFASGDSAAHLPPGVRLGSIFEEHYDRSLPWHQFHGTDALNIHLDDGFARTARALREGQFDVIHNNSLHRYIPRLSRAYGIPMVTSLHVPPFEVLRHAVHDSVSPWGACSVTSTSQRALWWPKGAPSQAIVVFNGIDCNAWPFAGTGDGSAVWAGRITPTKGLHLAVEAAAIAGIPLSIYGPIEHRDYFETQVRPALCRSIRYLGLASPPQLARAYRAASLFVFTPLWEEPFGLAAIEAMATGLPVAAIDMGAVREVIGDAGIFAPRDDATALARAMKKAIFIDNGVPRTRVISQFTEAHMIDGYLKMYERVMRGAGAAYPTVSYTAAEFSMAPASDAA